MRAARSTTEKTPTRRTMERAFYGRDAAYDGLFFTGVRTTSIFCRPSCPARKPKRENIQFFAHAREALFAGFRPCRRCQPLVSSGATPVWVETLLARVDAQPEERLTDAGVRAMGIDPARARRYFLRTHGMTFQAYCRARRLGGALREIRDGSSSIDDAVFATGYSSHSGFRTAFQRLFGTTPSRSTRAMKTVAQTRLIESPLGPLLAAATAEGLCLLEFSDRRMLERQTRRIAQLLGAAVVPGANPHLETLERELGQYFRGQLERFTVPLVYPGSEFQRAVWTALLAIPYGETRSYVALARAVGRPQGSRAVGQANGSNRIAIVIPCHRVVNADGKLGGYGGGRWRKEWLLGLERQVASGQRELITPPLAPTKSAPSPNLLQDVR